MQHHTQGYPSAPRNTECFECELGHGDCPEAEFGKICTEFSLISILKANELEEKRKDERHFDNTNIHNYDDEDEETEKRLYGKNKYGF